MRIREVIIGLTLVVFCSTGYGQAPVKYRLDTIARHLVIPWDLDFAPDGRIFVTERPGNIRIITPDGVLNEPWAQLEVANWQAAGLSGLALSPTFDSDGFVYVMGTFRKNGGYVNRIFRLRDKQNRGVESTQIIPDLPSINTHSGGALDFGPDGKLYVGMGDNEDISLVQQTSNTTGKILRYNADGSIPNDNPFPDNPVFAYGLRNPQGFAWHPENQAFFATEHGPSGFAAEGYREHQDELNQIVRNGNYGWPIVSGMHLDQRFVKPLVEWTPAIAPSGLALISDMNSPWYGNLFVGALRGKHLRRVELSYDDGGVAKIEYEELLFDQEHGRIRCVKVSPDGSVYFTTSNIDTPGEPKRRISREGDDHVFRLVIEAGN